MSDWGTTVRTMSTAEQRERIGIRDGQPEVLQMTRTWSEIERLQRDLANALAMLRGLEWRVEPESLCDECGADDATLIEVCVSCGVPRSMGHHPGCEVKRLLSMWPESAAVTS